MPTLISAAQGAEGDGEDFLRDSAPAPLETTNEVPPQVSLNGLRKFLHPNVSIAHGPPKLNNLQQIDYFDEHAALRQSTDNIFYPFSSSRDWQLGRWLTESSLSQNQINNFLKLDRVRALFNLCYRWLIYLQIREQPPSFSSAAVLRDRIERLPNVPEWFSRVIEIPGYRTKEPMVLYYRDGLRVMEHLFANPVFANSMDYTPYQLRDEANMPVVGEFMSGQFAWEYQVCAPGILNL